MRFQYKCQMSTCDPSFLLNKSSCKPHENYATDFHGTNATDLPFSYPGSLEEFYTGHLKHCEDKARESDTAGTMFDLADTTREALIQGHSFGSLALATHISHVKSGYFASDTVKGLAEILEYLSETSKDGCNFHRLLRSAREEYIADVAEFSKTPAGKMQDAVGLQYWRMIHGHNMLIANRSYTMHACNLNVFEEMLTRYLPKHAPKHLYRSNPCPAPIPIEAFL